MSKIAPTLLVLNIWGLMIAQVQLSKRAVVFKLDFSEKKKSISLWADPGESLP